MHTDITPLGRKIGSQNQTWSAFKEGPPAASKFDIQGVASCKRSKDCGNSQRQALRIATRQLHTAAAHMEMPKE